MTSLERQAVSRSSSHGRMPPHGSRPSSRASMRSSREEDDDASSDYLAMSFSNLNIDEILSRANSPSPGDDSNVGGSPGTPGADLRSKRTIKSSFSSAIQTLANPVRKTSATSRQNALAILYRTLSQKYEPEMMNAEIFSLVVGSLVTSKSDLETKLAMRVIATMALTDLAECAEAVAEQVLPKLSVIISSESHAVDLRAGAVRTYALLQYLMLRNSGGHGLEDAINYLQFIFLESKNEEAELGAWCLLGIGLLVGCAQSTDTSINRLIAETIDCAVDVIQGSFPPDVKNAAGKLVALEYQMYRYSQYDEETAGQEDSYDEEVDGPLFDSQALLDHLDSLAHESTRWKSKKDKKSTRSLFRDVFHTVEQFSTLQGREGVVQALRGAGGSSGLNDSSDFTIVHLKLNKAKALDIDSWYKVVLVQHLRWLLEDGLHSQIANNKTIQECIAESSLAHIVSTNARDAGSASAGYITVSGTGSESGWDSTTKKLTGKAKTKAVTQARDEKLMMASVI